MRLITLTKAFILRIEAKFKARNFKYKIIKNPRHKGYVNIIYILNVGAKSKNGGDKVIYKQSEVINNLNQSETKSSVLHVENTSIQLNWFEHNVKFKKDHNLDPSNDLVVIPEIILVPHAKLLSNIGVSYAIFVQNGYLVDAYMQDYDELALAYKNASLILAISEDAIKCIITAYPWAVDKIIRIFYSIDSNKFKSSEYKENLITYMPRKLARHSSLVKFFLHENLPKDWKLKEIHGLNELGVTELLGRSKIFLSFSELEGWGMPPIEAGLCGNYVIGYTGEGAKEYWKAPIFTEIYSGDIKKFIEEIIAKIEQLNAGDADIGFDSARVELASKYSEAAEKESLMLFLKKAEQVLNNKNRNL